ncbi:MAG: IS5/IS1182 family transposase, partial [Trueperaceae bacterium]|nr:IS5/IS1182 family transposase [Trueperaceae bacterium]
MLRITGINEIPGTTVQVAKAAFPKGNVYMQIRDELGTLYTDEDFAELYSETGRPAVPAWQLALVTVVQFKEGLADRQAA